MTWHRFRFSFFALIGGVVFIAGLGLQILLVHYWHIGPDPAYAAQAIFSVELSYLLNRYLTWRDRSVGWWAAVWKFNAAKLLMTVVNLAGYALLVRFGVQYVIANVTLTALCTPVNYFAADLLVFARGTRRGLSGARVEPRLPAVLPAVSVVVPCKNSQRTIRATVDALLAQDYPELTEVILVGDVGDPTWAALADVTDSRLVLIEQEETSGRRDPNVKRDKGIKKSRGDVIALADSDIVVDPGWVRRAVALLHGQGGGVVAGGMRSVRDTFWGRFVDSNVLAAKTPRVTRTYRVTANNFGARGRKPPITANAVFTRSLYDECSLDTAWTYGYEDYEWFWRLAKEKHAILYSSDLTAAHHHRRSFRYLVREYRQSAHGCAQFIRAHPDSPLARKRTLQAFGLPIGAVAALGLGALAVADGYGLLVAALATAAAVLVAGREVFHARRLEGLTYPPAALALGGIYAASIAGSLLLPARPRAALPRPVLPRPAPAWEMTAGPRRLWRQRLSWPLVVILTLQAGLSMSLIWANTAFGDEALYLWAGHIEISHWLHSAPGHQPALGSYHFASYFSGAPQLYPVLGALADSLGGVAGARLLSLAFMMGATLLLYSATARVFGKRAAPIAALAWVATESAMRMGAYATYDPMAIFLICLGAWFAIQSAFRYRHGELVALTAVALVLASVTAYSYAIYIPAIMTMAIFVWAREHTWKRAVTSGAWLLGLTGLLLAGLPTILKLWHGIFFTTLARSLLLLRDHGSAISIVMQVWSYGGLTIIAALTAGVISVALAPALSDRLLAAFLSAAVLLVPAYQIFGVETGWSLDKHMTCGMWLGAMAIGGGLSRISWPAVHRKWGAIAVSAVALFPLVTGWISAYGVQVSWPNETSLAAEVRPLLPASAGSGYTNLDPPYLDYYTMPESFSRFTWDSSLSLYPPGPQSKWLDYYRTELRPHQFALVVLAFPGTLKSSIFPGEVFRALRAPSQQQLVQVASTSSTEPGLYDLDLALDADPDYRTVATGPYDSGYGYGTSPWTYVIWQRVSGRKP